MHHKLKFSNKEQQHVFDIAMALMEDLGYEKLTIRKICTEADISIGKFYRFFNSKEDLLAFFYSDAEKAYKKECEHSLINLQIQEQLVKFYTWYTDYTASYGVEFVENFFNAKNPAMNTHIYNNEVINITDDLLAKAIQNGFKIPDSTTIRQISNDLCVIVKGIIFDWCARHGEFSLSGYTEALLKKCIDGMLD